MNRYAVTGAILIALGSAPACVEGQSAGNGALRPAATTRAQRSLQQKPEQYAVRIDGFQTLVWQPADNYFSSPGPVRIELRSFQLGENMILTADDAEGRPDGDISVRGSFRLVRGDAVLTGRELQFNAVSETGSLVGAEAVLGTMRLRGDRLVLTPQGGLVASGASFTTCSHTVPDYRIAAREIRLSENGTVTARGVSLFLGRTPVLAVPWMQKNFRQAVESPFPLPGYSRETGVNMRVRGNAITTPNTSLRYEVLASTRRQPFGSVAYERDLGRVTKDSLPPNTRKIAMVEPFPSALQMHPTFPGAQRDLWDEDHRLVTYAALGSDEYVGNRMRTDLRLSRIPEFGLAGFRSGVRSGTDASGSGTDRSHGANPQQSGADRWGYHWDVSVGWYRELPTDAGASRLGLRAGVASPGWSALEGIELRAGLSLAGAAYDRNRSYGVIAPEAEAMWRASRALQLGVGFRHQKEYGATPFVFDRADVRNEMRLYCRAGQVGWDFSLTVAYDTDRTRAYDTSVMVRRKLDCLEVGLSYRQRSQGLGLILNLLPGDHSRRSQP